MKTPNEPMVFRRKPDITQGLALPFVFVIICIVFITTGCVKKQYAKSSEYDSRFMLEDVTEIVKVAQLVGAPPDSINDTVRYDVYGADLGSMFNSGSTVYMVFGDTFGKGCPAPGGGPAGINWRSNAMAIITDMDPSDGLSFDTMIIDPETGHASELLSSKKNRNAKSDVREITVIPTHGIAVGEKMYLFFMSINTWEPWTANYSGLAVSEDGGRSWRKLNEFRWPGDSGFIQVSAYKADESDEGGGSVIYIWGTPAGRSGDIRLMKVNETDIENPSSYRYFARLAGDNPIWSERLDDAKPVTKGPGGEISVIYNEYLGRWIMTHFGGTGGYQQALYIKEGINPWGPWGSSIYMLGQSEYPSLYAGYMHPFFVENSGEYIYFTMSQWIPYTVFLMRARLVTGSR